MNEHEPIPASSTITPETALSIISNITKGQSVSSKNIQDLSIYLEQSPKALENPPFSQDESCYNFLKTLQAQIPKGDFALQYEADSLLTGIIALIKDRLIAHIRNLLEKNTATLTDVKYITRILKINPALLDIDGFIYNPHSYSILGSVLHTLRADFIKKNPIIRRALFNLIKTIPRDQFPILLDQPISCPWFVGDTINNLTVGLYPLWAGLFEVSAYFLSLGPNLHLSARTRDETKIITPLRLIFQNFQGEQAGLLTKMAIEKGTTITANDMSFLLTTERNSGTLARLLKHANLHSNKLDFLIYLFNAALNDDNKNNYVQILLEKYIDEEKFTPQEMAMLLNTPVKTAELDEHLQASMGGFKEYILKSKSIHILTFACLYCTPRTIQILLQYGANKNNYTAHKFKLFEGQIFYHAPILSTLERLQYDAKMMDRNKELQPLNSDAFKILLMLTTHTTVPLYNFQTSSQRPAHEVLNDITTIEKNALKRYQTQNNRDNISETTLMTFMRNIRLLERITNAELDTPPERMPLEFATTEFNAETFDEIQVYFLNKL